MNIVFDYIDDNMVISPEYVLSIEILNNHYLWRFLQDLIMINDGTQLDYVHVFDLDLNDLTAGGKMFIIMDYFNIDINCKKNLSVLNKYIRSKLDDGTIAEYSKLYQKLYVKLNSLLGNLDCQ